MRELSFVFLIGNIYVCDGKMLSQMIFVDDLENFVQPLRTLLTPSPSAAYMRQWIGSALVQIMACRLFATKPLSKPVPGHCELDAWEQTSLKFWSK